MSALSHSAASAPNHFGPSASQRDKQSTHCVRHIFVRSNQRQKVSQPWSGLANLRPLGCDVGQRVNEHRERFTTGQRRCRSKYGVKARIASGAADALGGSTVVGHQVCLHHAEMRSCRLVGEVEHVKIDRYPTNAATHLEWIDSVINEVTKELRPCALLPVGRIPNPRLPGSVVAARPEGGVCTGGKGVPCGALVPVVTGQPPSRCGGDRVAKTHT